MPRALDLVCAPVLVVMLLSAPACASSRGAAARTDATLEVPVSRTALQAGVIDALVTYDLPLLDYPDASGRIEAETRTIDSAYVAYADCGRSRAGSTLPTRARVETWLASEGERSTIRVHATFYRALPSDGGETTCRSTGRLEQLIADHAVQHASRRQRPNRSAPPPH